MISKCLKMSQFWRFFLGLVKSVNFSVRAEIVFLSKCGYARLVKINHIQNSKTGWVRIITQCFHLKLVHKFVDGNSWSIGLSLRHIFLLFSFLIVELLVLIIENKNDQKLSVFTAITTNQHVKDMIDKINVRVVALSAHFLRMNHTTMRKLRMCVCLWFPFLQSI